MQVAEGLLLRLFQDLVLLFDSDSPSMRKPLCVELLCGRFRAGHLFHLIRVWLQSNNLEVILNLIFNVRAQ